jgi:hypothetical protein
LHGGAEIFLTISNILVVLGFRSAIVQRKQSLKTVCKEK